MRLSAAWIQLANNAVLGLIDKITVLEENVFRLQSAGVMQSVEDRRENIWRGASGAW